MDAVQHTLIWRRHFQLRWSRLLHSRSWSTFLSTLQD